MLVSEVMRSIAMGGLMGCPRDDLAPLMAWMEERSREKARRARRLINRLCAYWSA